MNDNRSQGGGLRAIEAALDNAEPAAPVGNAAAPRKSADKMEEPELPLLPAGCPVTPLGKLGQICHFLDEAGQHIALDPQKVGKNHIRNMFGRRSYLCDEYWPRYGKDQQIDGWKPEIAGDILMRACAIEGIFDPVGRIRGRGAHLGGNGELILHCGDTVFRTDSDGTTPQGAYQSPGKIGRFVYPTAPEIPRPDVTEAGTLPATTLLSLFGSWNWARELADPILLLGWCGAAMAGGALDWRPHMWVTGSSATGKSTLQKALGFLFDGGALHTHDATEAALRQLLQQQTLPVFFDELEAEEDNRRNKAVIKLARLASSGAVVLRGGQDHVGHEFTARSCFLFSSILLPPMLSQDRNRLAVLDLNRIPQGVKPPVIDERELRELGRAIRRRIVDHWHRFPDLLHRYCQALADRGHGGRSQDQFGTLLAMADVLLYDVADDEVIAERAELLRADTLAEKATDLADEEEATAFLGSSFLPAQRGGDEPEPIARLIRTAINPENARIADRLENFGLKVMEAKPDGGFKRAGGTVPSVELFLAVANSHTGLERIFEKTRWSEGTWTQSFGRVEGAHRRVKVRFAGAKPSWATLVPLSAILDLTPGESDG